MTPNILYCNMTFNLKMKMHT